MYWIDAEARKLVEFVYYAYDLFSLFSLWFYTQQTDKILLCVCY